MAEVSDLSPPVSDSEGTASAWQLTPILEWLAHEGRLIGDLAMLLGALAERLLEAGAPTWRIFPCGAIRTISFCRVYGNCGTI